jgi:hypothetical protein
MGEVVSFVGYRPPERFDQLPWTEVRIEEAATETGTYAHLETIALSPLDTDPAHPAARSFTTQLGTDVGYWYRVIFADLDGDVSQPTTPVQNTAGSTVTSDVYGTTDELARILKLRAPTADQTAALERVLTAASGEVNSEIDRIDPLAPWQLMLATEVTLERAVEHWQQEEVPYGIWENAVGAVVVGRDTFERHALKLAPLKEQWGIS